MPLFAHGQGAYPAGDIVYESQARTSSPPPVTFGTLGARGLILVISVTAASSPSVTFTIRGVTPDNVAYDILSSAAITGVGITRLQVHPSLTAAANLKANDQLPDTVRIIATHWNGNSITYSVTAVLTP